MTQAELLPKDLGQCAPSDIEKARAEKGSCLVSTIKKPHFHTDRNLIAFIMGRREWRNGTRFVSAAKYEKYRGVIETLERKDMINVTVLNPA